MKFMTPQQYGNLLFQVFFKGRSLHKESENWNKKLIYKKIVQAGLYTLLFCRLKNDKTFGITLTKIIWQFTEGKTDFSRQLYRLKYD